MTRPRYVVIVPDGAGDSYRVAGQSPLAAAHTPYMDFVAREGVSGLMRTLYPDLPRESLVAQLGMLGWSPHRYYPGGRASCELLALEGTHLDEGDLAFRANLVRMEGSVLVSYNADFIESREAARLVDRLSAELGQAFPDFEIRHSSDFRTVLVVRGAKVHPGQIRCPEPHESQGLDFDPGALVAGTDTAGEVVAHRVNDYLECASRLLIGERANALFPWSPSSSLRLPSFAENTGFHGPAAVVGAMDFLCGMAAAGGMDFRRVGNGRPDTDYAGKGAMTVQLLEEGYELVFVHVNAPDEAAHMHDVALKIRCLERLDVEVVRQVVEYFLAHPTELGGVMVLPDHYTNSSPEFTGARRAAVHSLDPVPFALWNGRERDVVERFDEDAAAEGRYAATGLNHLDLLATLGAMRPGGRAAPEAVIATRR
ncbi:MAG TPA: hypothetical protein VHG28_15065 [Longimicrobiaceae bacterium]|nr:hypothetical protein [Longimicrobiaceae bacterium]